MKVVYFIQGIDSCMVAGSTFKVFVRSVSDLSIYVDSTFITYYMYFGLSVYLGTTFIAYKVDQSVPVRSNFIAHKLYVVDLHCKQRTKTTNGKSGLVDLF